MVVNLKQKTSYLLGLFVAFSATASAQIGQNRFDPGAMLNQMFRFDAGTLTLVSDFVTFFLIWFGFYAVTAPVITLAAGKAGGEIEKKINELFLGKNPGSYRDVNRKNWYFWLSGLGVLSLGPYLLPFIHRLQAAIVGGSTLLLIVFILVGGGGALMGVLYVLGLGGDIWGNNVAPQVGRGYDGAKDTLGSAYERGSNWVENRRNSPLGNYLGTNTYISDAGNLLDGALGSTGLHKCSNCGTWNRESNQPNCLNCGGW